MMSARPGSKYDEKHAEKDRREGRLGHPDELPPEEFIGLEETGEFPEWQPGFRQDANVTPEA
jgi:hypothetical protein